MSNIQKLISGGGGTWVRSDSWTPALKHDYTKLPDLRGLGLSCESHVPGGATQQERAGNLGLESDAVTCRRMLLSPTLSLSGVGEGDSPSEGPHDTCENSQFNE